MVTGKKRTIRRYICPNCGHELTDRRLQIQIRVYEDGRYTVSESFTIDTAIKPVTLKQEIIQVLLRLEKGGER